MIEQNDLSDWIAEFQESSPDWISKVHGDDPRFADILPPGCSIEELVVTKRGRTLLHKNAAVLRTRVTELEGLKLEGLMTGYLIALRKITSGRREQLRNDAAGDPWIEPLIARLGLRGNGPVTLEEAARTVGRTRERMRQIESKVLRARPSRDVWLPALERSIDAVRPVLPILDDEVGRVLADAGLADETFTGSSLIAAAAFGMPHAEENEISLIRSGSWITLADGQSGTEASTVAGKHTRKYGLTTVDEVWLALPEPRPTKSRVEDLLSGDPAIKWTSDGWLWIDFANYTSLHSNSLRNKARIILSVNSPVAAGSIREGFERSQRFRSRDIVPTVAAVKEFLAQHPEFEVQGELFRLKEPLDYHDTLGSVAASVVDLFKQSPYGVMDRESLQEAALEAQIPQSSVGIWTTYAEWMERLAPNVWGTRGVRVAPSVVDAVRESAAIRKRNEPHEKTWSWTAEGQIELVFRVTTSFRQTAVLSSDPSLQALLGGHRYQARWSNEDCGTVSVADDHPWIWGWGRLIRAAKPKQGQVVSARFDLGQRLVVINVGGDELLAV